MSYLPEIITALLLIALFIYFLFIRPKYKQEKLVLLTKFRNSRNRSIKLQDKVSRYILENDAAAKVFLQNITYGDYLKKLREEHENCFSGKMYVKLRKGDWLVMRKSRKLLALEEERLRKAEREIQPLS